MRHAQIFSSLFFITLLVNPARAAELPGVIVIFSIKAGIAALIALLLLVHGTFTIRAKNFKHVLHVVIFNLFNITLFILTAEYLYYTWHWEGRWFVKLIIFLIWLVQAFLLYKSITIYIQNKQRRSPGHS